MNELEAARELGEFSGRCYVCGRASGRLRNFDGRELCPACSGWAHTMMRQQNFYLEKMGARGT